MGRVVIPGFRKIETGGGGEGTTSNYEDLANKPSINGVPLTQGMSGGDLHLTNEQISESLSVTGDTANNIVSFTSGDGTDPTGWTDVSVLATGETHKSIFAKISTMLKNIRYLYKMLGSTDISSIGDGTATGAISTLNSNLVYKTVSEYSEIPTTAREIVVNTIVSNSGALGTITIPYKAYGTYLFGGWSDNYCFLEYQDRVFDITLHLDNVDYAHRNYTISYR